MRRRRRVLVTVSVALVVAAGLGTLVATSGGSAPGPSQRHPSSRPPGTGSLVDLSTPVDMANGVANPSSVVRVGDARIEVLSPTLMRLEYSPRGNFENAPTVNVVDRRMPVPKYTERVSGGWLAITTSAATLRYKVGSGPFTAQNTSVKFSDGAQQTTVHPTWDWECPFDQACQAGAATVSGGAQIGQTQGGYLSSAGYVGDLLYKGAAATWKVLAAPAGRAVLALRYSNVPNVFASAGAHTIELVVNGRPASTLVAPATDDTSPWSTITTTVRLSAGTDSVEVLCAAHDSCDLDLDTLSVGPADAPAASWPDTGALGGWIRGFDTFTYQPGQTCASGTQGSTCVNSIEPLHTDGLLDRAGWRLLDDTQSAVWTKQGWLTQRSPGGDLEDGYLFVYGHDYAGALRTFAQLTGPAPLLDRSLFGVWYSDYTPYSSAYIEDTLYPEFESNDVPLDTLSLDTDWKAPNSWDGWEWNTKLFPDPSSFLEWARAHGIRVTLNVHSSIADDDPNLPEAERIAHETLSSSDCTDDGPCKVWDWSSQSQAESNFALQQSFLDQGVSFWWLDWCCDDSTVSMPGVTPDSWIDHLYAQQMVNQGERGFVLARIGSSNAYTEQVYPAGPWSDHTSAIAFTGDAWGTWTTLAAEVALTPDEATIGEPYVSDDIGSYLGPPPQVTQDPPDLYDRWVQFGTFQPILRLHSDDESRLPWEYPQPVRGITEDFLRLRQELIPYTYTLASQANDDGMPITRPLYLDYPGQPDAYTHPDEYLYGSDMLVAPVVAPGAVASTTVWFPPGRWVDYFTGATFSGPATVTMSVPLDRMPVFVRAGGIIPEQASTASASTSPTSLVLRVFSGTSGSFDLYEDAGSGLGYTKGQRTETQMTDTSNIGGASGTSTTVGIGPAVGHYPGEPRAVGYRVEMVDVTAPSRVTLNGRLLAERSDGSAEGWYYDSASATLFVSTPRMATDHAVSVVATGSRSVVRNEPASS